MVFNLQSTMWQFAKGVDKTGSLYTVETLNKIYNALVYNSAEILPDRVVNPKPNPFLSHTALTAELRYENEKPIYPGLLYSELVCFIDRLRAGKDVNINLVPEPGLFKMEPFQNPHVEALREIGFTAFKDAGKFRYDSDVIRLNDFSDDGEITVLTVQRAKYSLQAKSNLILDFKTSPEGPTLRKELLKAYLGSLPPMSDLRLAQTIGVTVLLFYKEGGELKPFLVPRSRETAVLNEGDWSDSASGAAEWPEDEYNTPKTFEAYILDDMYRELDEELGLKPEDVCGLVPLAIAREFIRSGKPQIFFIGYTELSHNEILWKMEEQRKIVGKNPYVPNEINRMPLARKRPIVTSAKEVAKNFENMRIDPQAAASLYYAHRFFESQK